LYNDARSQIDEIAERILTIGSRPIGNLTEFLRTSEINELSDTLTDREMVQQIVNDQSILTGKMKILIDSASQVGDEGTVDMISGFLAMMEKESWMLKAWLA
jgi:starvation-inducible DNA-binding protein